MELRFFSLVYYLLINGMEWNIEFHFINYALDNYTFV